jgi:hypothetical protein
LAIAETRAAHARSLSVKSVHREAWVVGCADGSGQWLLCRASEEGYWAVVGEPERAFQFPTQKKAEEVCKKFVHQQYGQRYGAPEAWRVYQMTLRASFRDPEPSTASGRDGRGHHGGQHGHGEQ